MHIPKSVIVGSFMVFMVALYGAQALAAQYSVVEPSQKNLSQKSSDLLPPVGQTFVKDFSASASSTVVVGRTTESAVADGGAPQADGPGTEQISSKKSAYPKSADGTEGVTQASGSPTTPIRVSIPKISLNNPVVQVGLTSDGAMDVPSGKTNNVGWYKGGTVPGKQGSAVLDAHVFAAFNRLHELNVGDEIYVTDKDGVSRRFIVEEATTYALKDVPAERLFNRADAKRLNLITCAGKLTADHSTYTHRLIVYAVLAE